MATSLDIIRATYEAAPEEKGEALLGMLTNETVWTEAAGFPYAGTYIGTQAILENVFQRLAAEWTDFNAEPHTYVAEGDRVAVFGTYSGVYIATGKAMKAAFSHLYHVQDGKVVSMEQCVDSAMVLEAMR